MDIGLEKQRSGSGGRAESGRSFRSSPRGLDLETVAPGEDESEPETAVSQNGGQRDWGPRREGTAWERPRTEFKGEESYGEKPLIPKGRGQDREGAGRASGWKLEEGGRMLPPLEENSGGGEGEGPWGPDGSRGEAGHAGKEDTEHATRRGDASRLPGEAHARGAGVSEAGALSSRGKLQDTSIQGSMRAMMKITAQTLVSGHSQNGPMVIRSTSYVA